jgi:hypothetical protein
VVGEGEVAGGEGKKKKKKKKPKKKSAKKAEGSSGRGTRITLHEASLNATGYTLGQNPFFSGRLVVDKRVTISFFVSLLGGVHGSKPHLSRNLNGFTDYYVHYGQTDPPTRPVADLFPTGVFPEGDIQPHGKTRYPDAASSWVRESEEEKRFVCSIHSSYVI